MNFKISVSIFVLAFALVTGVLAGNPDRAGEAGAYELLINPFARSSGMYGLNTANTQGVESMVVNPAGMAFTKKTEIVFTYNSWLTGSGININAVAASQKFGKDKANVVGINLTAVSFGDIEKTTYYNPYGGIGNYSPSFINFAVGYSRTFSNSIYAGALVRLVNEKMENISATGFCVDAGIQYVTGKQKNIHFGLALKNVGLPMQFEGQGLVFTGQATAGNYQMSQAQRSKSFDLPSQLNIGIAYDWYIDKKKDQPDYKSNYRLTFDGGFIANAFGKDQFGPGMEFGWKEMVMLRVSYRYEIGLQSSTSSTSALTGLAAGFTVEVPFKKDRSGPALGIDYSFRSSSPFFGVHSVGLHFNL